VLSVVIVYVTLTPFGCYGYVYDDDNELNSSVVHCCSGVCGGIVG
jgi:hypothetical protein